MNASPDQTPVAQRSQPPQSPPPNRSTSRVFAWANRAMIFLVAAMVLVPMLVMGLLPAEHEKWGLAAANDRYLDGDLEGALTILRDLRQANPDNRRLYMTEAEWEMEVGNPRRTIDMMTELIAEHPDGLYEVKTAGDVLGAFEHYQLRSSAYQALGEFDKAVDDWERIAKLTAEFDSPMRTNNLAYARALAGEELFPSFLQMSEILRGQDEPSLLHQMAGYLHYRFLREGDRYFRENLEERERVFREGLENYNLAIAAVKAKMARLEASLDEIESEAESELEPDGWNGDGDVETDVEGDSEGELEGEPLGKEEQEQPEEDPNTALEIMAGIARAIANGSQESDIRELLQQRKKELAQIYSYRADLFEVVGDLENERQDRARVVELGFDEQEMALHGIKDEPSFNHLSTLAAWLDTRGYLLHKLNQNKPALKDMNAAVSAADALVSGMKWQKALVAQQSPDLREVDRQLEQAEHSLAVLLFHRYETLKELGRDAAAEQDRQRILDLGYSLTDPLF